ncbi:hypothetical protein MKW94_000878 [Papaver nudicaule]|uniref:Neprosin PEP catalytic domain-containing protein n=1 Tax=Papaver nudicaule TaxID=74823 RepID=A0AA41S853_PAPNU|nr:hypothetical protein [Papaver nudicaule]
MEFDNKLKILNKPPVKSIHTKFGDIYDCINIYKQPAFDHPLLKNHKIQMKPNVVRKDQSDEPISNIISSSVRSKVEGCPLDTVPIRRTTKQDLVNAELLTSWIKQRHFVSVQPFAEKVYYGASARITVANPGVEQDKYSTGQIWIQKGPAEELNSIEFGWAVHPQLFGDNDTRVFGLWTADGFKETGCYNMLCPGFVQIHPEYTFGERIKASTYGAWVQRAFDFSVHRDLESGNWWFINGVDNAKIGYWPKEIFTHLASNASVIGYGGAAGGEFGEPSPPMGHARLPVYDSRSTCCHVYMKLINDKGIYVDFDRSHVQLNHDTKTSCYDLIFPGREIFRGNIMLFGGPGGDCP